MDDLLHLATRLADQPATPLIAPIPGRVAYMVSHGQSYASNGYAIRTQGIAQALNQHGFETLCFVRPGRPWELNGGGVNVAPETVVKGVRYLHSAWPQGTAPADENAHLEASVARFVELFQVYRPAIVLAASNYTVGLPAWIAAKRLGLPFYNEVRGFWELSRDAREPGYAGSPAGKREAKRDAFVARQAQKVFTLNLPMQEELGRRGVDVDRVEIVPNGMSALPEIKPADPMLRKRLGIGEEDRVVGYVGSIAPYEGLDTLIDTCAELVDQGERLKLVIVGDDQPITSVVGRTDSQADHPWLIQVGRVPHDEVASYYALIDTVVIPRKKLPVCELVPPMKATEALAYGKRLVVSDVAPLAEYARKYEGVVSFNAGSAKSLTTGLQGSLKLPVPKPTTELLFAKHTEPMVRALKGEGSGFAEQPAPAAASKPMTAPHSTPAKALATADAASAKPSSSQHSLGVFSRPETVELPSKDPLWHSVPVKAGQALIIEAASEYRNIKGAQNRKAVLLINAFDADGKPVDTPCGKMAKSGHLKAYFKYLPCTQNQIQELHSFSVPEGVSEIRIGVCGFNKKDDEQVMLRELRMQPKPYKSQSIQFVPPSAQAAEISILGWPEQPPNSKPYVIGVMDEFTTGCFEQDVNLIQPRPDNWYALAEKYQPEFFFIESAWKGNYASWQYRVADYANKPGQEIAHICQYAREKGIPTLFWNKEDPVHHQKFMCSAKLVDHIFTTDANMKDSYQAKTGNPNVHAMPFAAQPALHKPAPLAGRKPRACFAGSWYGNRHAERGEAMRWLLQAANRHGLDIFDRNHGTGIFPFPEEYQAGIKGSLPYKELCGEYSRYRVFLNVNSVTDSPTMFSRRVFELMACGTPVVNTYAKGIDNLFDSDAVWLVHSQEEADAALHTLMTDDAEWRRRSLAGIREVFAKHTYAHRLNDIFDRLGIETRLPTDPAMALVAEAHSQADLEMLNQFARKQSYRHFQLGIACAPGLAQLAGSLSENITLLQRGQKAPWLAEQHAESPLAGWLSPQALYGEHYLRDLANASLYEPEAGGWAKAPEQDRFAYGAPASLGGALWKHTEFLKQPIKAHPEARITRPDLYLADCDQFQLLGAAQQAVGG
ncbi:glycosyltransferase [Halomonas sp. PAR7]|uniref:glycosyltransferase family protein n=1 Tax=Halomonas sp. PAR7 TaxID=3075514 RepID=UPI00288857A1|nr:glycosyltransferase [Halomonas sp. PAR7]MDT0500410.1 glycosyltransferase [Halomonas sp. PAR7]